MISMHDNLCASSKDELEKINCPLCASKDFSPLYDVPSRECRINKMFKIVKCCNCGLVYLNPRVKKDFIKQYYPKSYYQVNISDPEVILKTPYEKEKLILMRTFKLLKNKEKSILDVGCNKGEFLENLKRRGRSNLKGIEFNGDCAKFAREEYNLDIFFGGFLDFPENEKFDIITFWHSLEHFYDINSTFEKSAKLLKENGAIVISVPNIKSPQASIMGRYWYHIDAPRHTACFDKYRLQRLLGDYNFVIKNSTYRYPSHNLNGWHSSFLNMWGNFKRTASKTKALRQQEHIAEKLSSGKSILLRVLKVCMRLLSCAEMAIGSGGTITVIAGRSKE